jgi:Skp family chaperone for outer membrane proteins
MKKLALSLALISIGILGAATQESYSKELVAAPSKEVAIVPSTKIGYVHIEQIFNEKAETPCHEVQDKVKSLQNELGDRQKKLQSDQMKLEKEAAELEPGAKSKWTSEASRESAREDLLKRKDEWTASARRFQEYAQRQQQKVQTEMLEKIVKNATAIGEKQGYDIIFASGALYTSKKVNITHSVVSTLNKEYDASKAKKEAKAAKK